MFHTLTAMVSLTEAAVDVTFPKTLAVNDFYWRDPRGGFDMPMGHIQLLEYMSGQTLEGETPTGCRRRSSRRAGRLRGLATSLHAGDLRGPAHGRQPRPPHADGRIQLDYQHNNLEGHDRLVKTLKDSLDGFVDHAHPISQHHFQLDSLLPLYGTAHQCGTRAVRRRSGLIGARSLVQGPRTRQPLLVDTAFFVTAGAVNPTLTTVANAMRVGDHLIERLGARLA